MDKPDKPENDGRLELPRDTFEDLVKELSDSLTAGPISEEDKEARIKERIRPPYEFRIQAKVDPIAEETKRYRDMAEEIDDRYDDYMKRLPKKDGDNQADE